jgi:hypothetical protein
MIGGVGGHVDWEALMRTMTLEQLRAAHAAGGVLGVTLKGEGGGFRVEIQTRSGDRSVLCKARSTQPRMFGNPATALHVLLDIGIAGGEFDASQWDPRVKIETEGNRGRADAMRQAHRARAYVDRLNAELQASIDDPRPSIGNDEVMKRIDARIAEWESAGRAPKD